MGWFDEQGWGGGRVVSDEERERQRQELIALTGGRWSGEPGGASKVPMDDGLSHIPTMDFRTGGDSGAAPDDRVYNQGPFGPGAGGAAMPGVGGFDKDAGPYLGEKDRSNLSAHHGMPSDDVREQMRAELTTRPDFSAGDGHIPTMEFRRGEDEAAPMPPMGVAPPAQPGTLGAVGMAPPPGLGPQGMGAFGGMSSGSGYAPQPSPFSAFGGQAPTAALQSQSGYKGGGLGGFAGGGGAMMRAPTGGQRQVPRAHIPFYQQRGATEVR